MDAAADRRCTARSRRFRPATVNGRIKITEQGEIVSQQFGLLPVAERTLEVTLAGVADAAIQAWPGHRLGGGDG